MFQVELTLLQLLHQNIEITASGFFKLNYSIIYDVSKPV